MKYQNFKIFLIIVTITILFSHNIIKADIHQQVEILNIWDSDVIIIPDTNPYYAIIASSISCYYTNEKNEILKPLLIINKSELNEKQKIFIKSFNDESKLLSLGIETTNHSFQSTSIIKTPIDLSLHLLTQFNNNNQALILPYDKGNGYELSLIACPISNYLNIPIILYENNSEIIKNSLIENEITNLYIVGNITNDFNDQFNVISLKTKIEIQNKVLEIIKQRFGKINYLTVTNPSDTKPMDIINQTTNEKTITINNTKIIIFGKSIDIKGSDSASINFQIPDGLNQIQIYANISKSINPLSNILKINSFISINLKNTENNTIAYSNSAGFKKDCSYIETITNNASGLYELNIQLFNGFKGGYFSHRGLSIHNSEIKIKLIVNEMKSPHYLLISKLSMMAPYLTAAHGGIIIADPNFELTTDDYQSISNGFSTGPWYNEELHTFNNEKVNYTKDKIIQNLNLIDNHEMLDDYLNGSAWLALLGDTNMIPMYYYQPSQPGLVEKGLPSDNPYSLNESLSIGRLISYE